MIALAYAAFATTLLEPLFAYRAYATTGHLLWLRPTVIWIAMGILLMFVRTLLWLRYRPFAAASSEEAPLLTVVIPAYNEGEMVEARSPRSRPRDYPHDRLADHRHRRRQHGRHLALHRARGAPLSRARHADPARAKPRQARRARRGLPARDAARSSSPSTPTASSSARRCSPSPARSATRGSARSPARSPSTTARPGSSRACCTCASSSRSTSCAARSRCSAPCTAARARSPPTALPVVRGVLAALGTPDLPRRALHLRRGPRAHQPDPRARATTRCTSAPRSCTPMVPTTYAKLCKMFLRWDRSYIREEFRFARSSGGARFFSRVAGDLRDHDHQPALPGRLRGDGAVAASTRSTIRRRSCACCSPSWWSRRCTSLYYLRSERSWDFVFGILYAYFSFFALTWIFPYAALTLRARGWLTR